MGHLALQCADWLFPAQPRSVSQARALIAQELNHLPDESMDVLLLLTSELMTNAVRHGLGPVGLTVGWDDTGVRVEVEDQSARLPVVQVLDYDALNGRGLLLVDSLSSGWGVRQSDETSKTVWFSLHV